VILGIEAISSGHEKDVVKLHEAVYFIVPSWVSFTQMALQYQTFKNILPPQKANNISPRV
jgi:hypothetical protein